MFFYMKRESISILFYLVFFSFKFVIVVFIDDIYKIIFLKKGLIFFVIYYGIMGLLDSI